MDGEDTGIALHGLTVPTAIYFLTLLTLLVTLAARFASTVAGWRRARAARRRFSEPAPRELQPGPVELAGTVETEPPGTAAIRVQLRQTPCAFSWTDVERTVDSTPFTLVLHGTGARVPVLPGDRPRIIARGQVTSARAPKNRVLTAWIQHGERVRVQGRIVSAPDEASGYRHAGRAAVLEGTEDEPLCVEAEGASLAPAGAAARRPENRVVAILSAIACGAAIAWHTGMLLTSTTVDATVVSSRICSSTNKGHTSHHPCFTAANSAAGLRFDDMPGPATPGDLVRVSYARAVPSVYTKGNTLDPDILTLLAMVGGSGMLWVAGALRFHARRERRDETQLPDIRESS